MSHHAEEILFTAEFWDARYAAKDAIWSGRVNPQLIAQTEDLEPGSALDVGSGEGADATWLAEQGWTVTGVDVSVVALGRAAAHADAAGVGDRIAWQQVDVLTWEPPRAAFDLVSAQYMHLPVADLRALHGRLAAAVRPGGTLLIVLHHADDLHTSIHRPDRPDLYVSAEQMAEGLSPSEWRIVRTDTLERQTVDPDGHSVTISDAVLRAVRIA